MYIYIFTLAVVVFACKKEPAEPERRIVPGNLLIGIYDDITIAQVFHFSDSLGFTLANARNYTYITDLPADSLQEFDSLLNSKLYLSKDFTKSKIINNRLQVGARFIHLDSADLLDWKLLAQKFMLEQITYSHKSIMLKVPEGTEKLWEAALKTHPYVRWIELNYYSGIRIW